MDNKKLLIIAIIVVVMTLTVVLTIFFNEVTSAKQVILTDHSREQPSVGGKVSITILNTTMNEENTTNENAS